MKPLVITIILWPTKGIDTEEIFQLLTSAIHHNLFFNYLIDLYRVEVDLPNDKRILLNIWKINISFQERTIHKAISLESYIRTSRASGAILLFDLTNPDSYNELVTEREYLEKIGGISKFSIIGVHSDETVESNRNNLKNHMTTFGDACYEINGDHEKALRSCIQELTIQITKNIL